ncbi:hypothetical protein F2P81_016988 [Scophthalmus maximus]|uniref:Uncharacterized protein n=1 Tax=Scophthalmus maximus TaxID=52904 RepID=A0A6A4SAM9_SCOMX|nr:hypothetical protein F2P81_016988 [Scophthalmus maximus]
MCKNGSTDRCNRSVQVSVVSEPIDSAVLQKASEHFTAVELFPLPEVKTSIVSRAYQLESQTRSALWSDGLRCFGKMKRINAGKIVSPWPERTQRDLLQTAKLTLGHRLTEQTPLRCSLCRLARRNESLGQKRSASISPLRRCVTSPESPL